MDKWEVRHTVAMPIGDSMEKKYGDTEYKEKTDIDIHQRFVHRAEVKCNPASLLVHWPESSSRLLCQQFHYQITLIDNEPHGSIPIVGRPVESLYMILFVGNNYWNDD